MSVRSQTIRTDTIRSPTLSASPRRGDLTISGPFPHPLPAGYSASTEDGSSRASQPPSSASFSQSQQSRSSLPWSARAPSRPSVYQNNRIPSSSHAPQDSISSSVYQPLHAHRRRASTLRSVMRKIFGRKRHSGPDEDGLAEDDREVDPRETTPQWGTSSLDKTAPFLPISEGRTRSRRSQSLPSREVPFSKDRPVSEHGLSPRKRRSSSLQPSKGDIVLLGTEHGRLRRRATLPSIVLSTEEARELVTKAHQDARGSEGRLDAAERTSLDSIHKRYKRRSRSANELRVMASEHLMSPIQWRRYSDETRPRGAGPQPEQAPPERPRPASEGSRGGNNAEGSDDALSFGEAPLPLAEGQFENGFDFGSLIETMQETGEASLAHRVATLEVKLMDLELAIAKLQGQDMSPLKHPRSESRSQMNRTHPAPPTDLQPRSSLRAQGRAAESVDINRTPTHSSSAGDSRSDSIDTIRPETSSRITRGPPPNPDFQGISVEQYSALTMLVRREQTARKLLETQIVQLRKEVEKLQRGRRSFDPESFFCPSSPDSVIDDASSPRVDSVRVSKDIKSRKEGREKRITDSFRRHPLASRSFYSDSERPQFSQRSTVDSSDPRNRIPGMI